MTGAANDLFLHLTPERVLEAVEASGIRCTGLCYPLSSFENRVYEVEVESETGNRERLVAKFYRPGRWSREQILAEHRLLDQLVDAEIPVCNMRRFADGRTLHEIFDLWYCLADRRGGRAPDELHSPDLRRLGRLIARMHNVASLEAAPSRLSIDADNFIREPIGWLDRNHVLPLAVARRYRTVALEIADLVEAALANTRRQRIHGDLHLGNVLLRDDELRLLDFDDMAMGPAVQDLWLAVPGRDPQSVAQRDLLIEAYSEFRDFDRSTLALVEPLRALRMVRYNVWLAQRWHDPIFPLTWPHFGTEEFWLQEVEDLEDQLGYLEGARLETAHSQGWSDLRASGSQPWITASAVPEGPAALTNKDYFWDWEGD